MGCKFSSTKGKDTPSQNGTVHNKKPLNGDGTPPEHGGGKENPRSATGSTPAATSPHNGAKHPTAHESAAADDKALEDDLSNAGSPTDKKVAEQPIDAEEEGSDGGEGGSGADLTGSFVNVDLNGSFHIHYNMKGDIIPNATLPESRRGRSVSPKLLAALSPHPSDDELVLICTDCGMAIDENCETLCPLTGKLHI